MLIGKVPDITSLLKNAPAAVPGYENRPEEGPQSRLFLGESIMTLILYGALTTLRWTMSQRSRVERRNRCVSGLRGALNMTVGGASSTIFPSSIYTTITFRGSIRPDNASRANLSTSILLPAYIASCNFFRIPSIKIPSPRSSLGRRSVNVQFGLGSFHQSAHIANRVCPLRISG